ncbi:MAG: host attachment protein [Candidatus Dactylopiibacterium sp.]|nr:host attachment protein [Candidatus Dactylopiibacterium sp.]
MSMTWIVVANARHARIFSHAGPNKGLELLKETELEEDAIATVEASGRASPKHKSPLRQTAQGFAQRLARDLCSARTRGAYQRAILVAPPAFMGLLNAELDAPTASLVSQRVDKDYTRSETATLSSHLDACLCV